MTVYLTIYGVFDRCDDDRCVMVGSTIRQLTQRVKLYKRYKWFQPKRYEHKVLWRGDVVSDESLPFVRAVKESCWIGRMKTWYDQGGRNQMNPVLHALGNPNFFTEQCLSGGRATNAMTNGRKGNGGRIGGHIANDVVHQADPKYRECRVRGGRVGGQIGGRIGGRISGRIRHEALHRADPKDHEILSAAGSAGAHQRWHISRVVNNS